MTTVALEQMHGLSAALMSVLLSEEIMEKYTILLLSYRAPEEKALLNQDFPGSPERLPDKQADLLLISCSPVAQ